jgi:hypothetical protein
MLHLEMLSANRNDSGFVFFEKLVYSRIYQTIGGMAKW